MIEQIESSQVKRNYEDFLKTIYYYSGAEIFATNTEKRTRGKVLFEVMTTLTLAK